MAADSKSSQLVELCTAFHKKGHRAKAATKMFAHRAAALGVAGSLLMNPGNAESSKMRDMVRA